MTHAPIIIVLLLILSLASTALTQDEAQAKAYLFTGSNECEIIIDVTVSDDANAPILLTLADSGQVIDQQVAPYTFRLPVGRTDYTLMAEHSLGDAEAYSVDGREDCPPIVDAYTQLEEAMFKRMNWTDEEIDWFRRTFSPDDSGIFGSQRDYIYAVAELYEQLDAADAQPPSTPVPAESTTEPTAESTSADTP